VTAGAIHPFLPLTLLAVPIVARVEFGRYVSTPLVRTNNNAGKKRTAPVRDTAVPWPAAAMLTRHQLFVISLVVASIAAALALDNGLALYNSPPQMEFLFLPHADSRDCAFLFCYYYYYYYYYYFSFKRIEV